LSSFWIKHLTFANKIRTVGIKYLIFTNTVKCFDIVKIYSDYFILQAFEETIRLTAIFWQRNVRQQKSYAIVIIIYKEYSNPADREIFSCYVSLKTWDTSVVRRNSRGACPSFAESEEKESNKTFTLLPPLLLDFLRSEVVTSLCACVCACACACACTRARARVCVCVECFYSITPAARRHSLNHLLNPRPSALSSPRLQLMAFENSNIIRRSILSLLRTGMPQRP